MLPGAALARDYLFNKLTPLEIAPTLAPLEALRITNKSRMIWPLMGLLRPKGLGRAISNGVDNGLRVSWVRYNRYMAKNGPKGGGRRGKISNRSQVFSGRNKRWTKVNAKTGRFMDQMARKGRAWRGVRMK